MNCIQDIYEQVHKVKRHGDTRFVTEVRVSTNTLLSVEEARSHLSRIYPILFLSKVAHKHSLALLWSTPFSTPEMASSATTSPGPPHNLHLRRSPAIHPPSRLGVVAPRVTNSRSLARTQSTLMLKPQPMRQVWATQAPHTSQPSLLSL